MFRQNLSIKYIVAFIGLLLFNQLQAQEENWQNYIANFENKPGSVIVDMQLKEVGSIKQLPIDKDRTCFLQKIKSDGLTIDEKNIRSDVKHPYELKISRSDSIDPYKITTVNIALRKISCKLYG